MDEELERPLAAAGRRARHGRRHEAPAERLGEQVRGDLAPEEPGREIPQRPLAALRLVDGQGGGSVEGQLHQERGVAAARHPALHGDVAAGQQVEGDRRIRSPDMASASRGRWPAGRRGPRDPWAGCTPGRSGVPPSSSSFARSTKRGGLRAGDAEAGRRGLALALGRGSSSSASSASISSLASTTTRSLALVVADAERADGPGDLERLEQLGPAARGPRRGLHAGEQARTGTRPARARAPSRP